MMSLSQSVPKETLIVLRFGLTDPDPQTGNRLSVVEGRIVRQRDVQNMYDFTFVKNRGNTSIDLVEFINAPYKGTSEKPLKVETSGIITREEVGPFTYILTMSGSVYRYVTNMANLTGACVMLAAEFGIVLMDPALFALPSPSSSSSSSRIGKRQTVRGLARNALIAAAAIGSLPTTSQSPYASQADLQALQEYNQTTFQQSLASVAPPSSASAPSSDDSEEGWFGNFVSYLAEASDRN